VRAVDINCSSEVIVSRDSPPRRARAATASRSAGGSAIQLLCTTKASSGIIATASSAVRSLERYWSRVAEFMVRR
jgi:hypothetical protein